MTCRCAALILAALVAGGSAEAGVRRVWAVHDGEKVERDAVAHAARARNAVWDGRVVRLSSARNEIVAFQVIVEADAGGIDALSLRLPSLDSDRGRIVYRAPADDPTDYAGRPIQIFAVNYMLVTTPSHASWVYARGSAAAPPDPTGWKPVQLVPEKARSGRGGLPVTVRPNENQAIWVEVYVDRERAAGLYRGSIEVRAGSLRRQVPIELEVFDFTLPDENSMHAMLFYTSDQAERYHGRNLDPAYHRLAHRHRVELVHAYDERTVPPVMGRFSGADFTRERGYEGPGEGVGNVLAPRTFYGPGRDFDNRATAWARSDAWMTFLREKLPRAITFLYVPDEPRPPEYPRILALAENIHSNPGPGRALPVFVTSKYVPPLDTAIDIWCSGPKGFDLARVASERARGRQYWFYNGGRPAGGAITIDAPATDPRATIWAAFKHDVGVYFYWHAVHWRHNSQKQGERDQNVWAETITFDNRRQENKSIDDQGYIHGDGVLIYPGEERLHPDQDRGVPGPVATVQLANFRRGLQDHQYLTLARALGLHSQVDEALAAIVPRVFSEAGERVSFPETGDPYEAARVKLGRAIAAASGEWPVFGGDAGARRFSPLTQIARQNVASLERAWTFETGARDLQVTPIVVNGVMYLTAGPDIVALEPETGKRIWSYKAPAPVSRRGVAYWPGAGSIGPRLFSGAGDRMVAVDAKTGSLVTTFGDGGFVDLKQGIRGDADGRFSLITPPAVYKDVLITGGSNTENEPSFGLYGDIRGWDARTGKLLWSFHTVPRPGEPGVDTWEGESWKNRSGTNAWTYMTVDVDRGLVFAVTGSPTSDFYGADRRGQNLYGNSVLALDAATGRLEWFKQLVHHDIWDWDLPAAPTLIEVARDGRRIPAVAVITKMSTLFIFDRATGEPLFGMEERPVPQSDVPGEATWPTQPFPLQPPPLSRTTFDPAKDFYTLTPEHAAYCRDLWDRNRMYTKGIFTPPGLDGTMVMFPSTLGGGNWSGLSYDASRGLVFANIMNLGQVARMERRPDPATGEVSFKRTSPWKSPYARFWNPDTKVPCSAPPFGELVAVDVNRAAIVWRTPLGSFADLEARGFGKTGAPNIGGSIATASGLLFIGGTIDKRFRAFDTQTGALLWETALDASAHATPMTFMGRNGRQYVVVAAGGDGLLGSPPGSTIVAFRLPR